MSGPKGFALVLAERARVAQETDAARARCVALLGRRDAAAQALESLTGTKNRPKRQMVATLDLQGARALETALSREVAEHEERLHDVRVQVVRQHLADAFAKVSAHEIVLPPLPAAPTPAERRAAAEAEHRSVAIDRLQGRLRRVLDAVAQVDDTRRQSLAARTTRLAGYVIGGHVAQAELLLLDLQTDVEHALRDQRTRDGVRAQAADLVVRTAHVRTAEADALRGRALASVTRAELAEVRAAIDVLLAAHRAAEDRAYVIEQTRAALADLGYEVGEEFVSVALAGMGAVATRGDLTGYGLQWRFGPGPGQVFTNVVAFRASSTERDTEVEETTCGHIDSVRTAWRDHGVDARLGHHREPGQVAVERLAAPAKSATTRAAAGRTAKPGAQAAPRPGGAG